MERTISSLTYKGSIPEAIIQSRREKKLFAVYISGEDETSSSLEQTTLVDENVVEVIGRCCIFLHLKQGHVDASQFSAIYPQKAIPSISVIGLDGVMLWHHEGYISSEDLKENIEKPWAALHLKDAAATLLAASLASRIAEPVNTTSTTLPPQGGSSTSDNTSTSSSQSTRNAGAIAKSTDLVAQPPSSMSHDENLNISEKEHPKLVSDPGNSTVEEKPDSTSIEVTGDCSRSSNMDNSANPNHTSSTPSLERKNKLDDSCAEVRSVSDPIVTTNRGESLQLPMDQDKATTASTTIKPSPYSVKSDDIELVIRIPNGPSLQIKLTKKDTLRKVKNFVDENHGGGAGSYDLAMLYPRKVFTEQDMETMLCDLGIETRQALTLIPHRQPVQAARRLSSSSPHDTDSNINADNSGNRGYFSYLRTVMSYANPLSYLRGNPTPSNPEQLANAGSQQHRPISRLLDRPGTEPAESQILPGNGSQQASRDMPGSTLRKRPKQFGGNIHSLRSEDQGPSDERNVFWNGNSTEYGGDDKK